MTKIGIVCTYFIIFKNVLFCMYRMLYNVPVVICSKHFDGARMNYVLPQQQRQYHHFCIAENYRALRDIWLCEGPVNNSRHNQFKRLWIFLAEQKIQCINWKSVVVHCKLEKRPKKKKTQKNCCKYSLKQMWFNNNVFIGLQTSGKFLWHHLN